jgi:hypothetical protein
MEDNNFCEIIHCSLYNTHKLIITEPYFICAKVGSPTYQTTCRYLELDGRISKKEYIFLGALGYRSEIQILAALVKARRGSKLSF